MIMKNERRTCATSDAIAQWKRGNGILTLFIGYCTGLWCCDQSAVHSIMAVVTVVAKRLFVASVVNRVGNSALDGLRKDLLNLLRDDGGVTIVLGVCLGCGLVSLAAGGVDLNSCELWCESPILAKRTESGRASSRPEGA